MTSTSKQWVIIGQYDKYKCLVCALPFNYTLKMATEVLNRMINNPTDTDRLMRGEASELWLEEVDGKDAWWNDNCD